MFHVKQSDRSIGSLAAVANAARRLAVRLFHVKQFGGPFRAGLGERRPAILGLLLILAVPLIVACDVADQPDGWAAPTPDPIEPETRLIAPTGDDQVIALQLLDGNLSTAVWEFPDDDGRFPGLDSEIEPVAFYADPVWVESTDEWLFAGYSDGILYAVRRDGESARVVFNSESRLVADLVVDDSIVYLADTSYRVHAVDIEQPGEAIWTWNGNSDLQIWGGPALVETERGTLLIVAGLDGRVTAINVEGEQVGRSAWQVDIEGGIAGSVTAADGIVYVGSLDRMIYGLDAATGGQVWATQASHWLWGTPLIHDGVMYATDLRGNVYAIDARTGAKRWLQPFAAGDRIRARPLFVEQDAEAGDGGGILVIVARGGMIHQLSASDGAPLRQFQLDGAKDLMANAILREDRILVSDEDGVLYAVLLGANHAVKLYPQN